MQPRNRELSAFAAATILAFTACNVSAQTGANDADGCAVLADVVYGEIFVSALFGGTRLPPEPGQGDAISCDHTAASVSAGFSRAMAAMNVYVSWSGPDAHDRAGCATRDLALCTPLPRHMTSHGSLDPASVAEMWRVVTSIVRRNMPLGTASDRLSFREYELRLRLSDALVHRYWDRYGWVRPR